MAIQYAGGTNVNTTFSGTTRTEIADGIKAALVTAGWSVISGSSGNWKLGSGVTPNGQKARIICVDPGSGNCCKVYLTNDAETVTFSAQPIFLIPAALKTWRIIASQYQFCVFVPGSGSARDFGFFTIPYVPSFLSPSPLADVFFEQGNAGNDGDATARSSFRTTCAASAGSTGTCYGGVSWTASADGGGGTGRLMVQMELQGISNNGYRWIDDSYPVFDPLIMWGNTGGAECKIRAQLWDAFCCTVDYVMDTLVTYDGKQFMCITNSATGTNRNSLFLYAP